VARDGTQFLIVTRSDAVLRTSDRFEPKWQSRIPIGGFSDVAFLDDCRAVVTTGTELIQVSLACGAIIKRVPTKLRRFAVLGSGLLVGAFDVGRKSGLSHAVISPEDGKTMFDFADHALYSDFTVADATGTRFATGAMQVNAWIGDPYVRAMRQLTREGISQNDVRAGCFDPSGRYLAAGVGGCEVVVFDLMDPPIDFRESPRYLGKFHRPRVPDPCTGIGFIDGKWLWFANGRDLHFYTWPGLKPAAVTGPPDAVADFFVWKASADGHLLVGINLLGKVYIGQLRRPAP
jgi:hypothetical protein